MCPKKLLSGLLAVFGLLPSKFTYSATVYRLCCRKRSVEGVEVSFVDIRCGCCSEGPLDCERTAAKYWGRGGKNVKDQLEWWMNEFASRMIERLSESHSCQSDVDLHITTMLRHGEGYPSNTQGEKFLSVFPRSVLDVHDYSRIVNHCSIFFQKIFTAFSDKNSVRITHYVQSHIGGTRAVDLSLLFLFENKPSFFENLTIREKWYNSFEKHYEEARAPLFRVYHELMNQDNS